MLDGLTSLAFSVHSSKGIYALLLGSGLSTAAGIPTGWDITLDLIKKSASANNENCGADPAAWFKSKSGREADYSDLLDALAKTPADRSSLLSAYFEPSAEDAENGLKSPTTAHKIIARLVVKGYIRVIVTTNFDRLLERALEAESISPTIISTADGAKGALPLAHARCTVVKVHGDYRDTRIKNTATELDKYDAEINALLDEVFDEYGLIVCGWSAKWDKALYRAILRTPNRRFTTYWTRHATLTSEAQELVTQRRAIELMVSSADSFFSELETKLDAIERYSEPHPASTKLAVVSLKKFIVDEKKRIELRDLVSSEIERSFDLISPLPLTGINVTLDVIFDRMKLYENALSIPIALFAHGGFWSRSEHHRLWGNSLIRVAGLPRPGAANTALLQLRWYAPCLMLYSIGLGATAAENYGLLRYLCRETKVKQDAGEERPLSRVALPWNVLDVSIARQMPGYERHYTPVNDRLFDVLRESLREYLPGDSEYDEVFDRFEYLVALVEFDQRGEMWAPVGRFGWRSQLTKSIVELLSEEANAQGVNWAILQSGLFSSIDRFRLVEKGYRENVLSRARSEWI